MNNEVKVSDMDNVLFKSDIITNVPQTEAVFDKNQVKKFLPGGVDVTEDDNDIAYKLDVDSIKMIDDYVVAEYAMIPTSDRGLDHIRKLIQNNKTEFVITRIVFTNTKIKKFQITSMTSVDSNGNIIKVLDTKLDKNKFKPVTKGAISSDLCDAIFHFLQNI
jgi:hypothetical protein